MSKLNSISFLSIKFSKLQVGLIKLIGVLATTSSISFASADQDSDVYQIGDGYVFGSNATVSVVADDELNKDVVELQIPESGNFDQGYVGLPVSQEDFSTASAFEFKVLDQQGSNTVYITLVDSAGDKWSGWSSDEDKTVLNTWTNIVFDYTSAVSSIDLTQVSEVRFSLWNAGTYRFSDVALLSSSNAIDTVNVTFQVDMSAVDTHPEGVYLAGGGVFGQDGFLMTDNGSDVWTATVNLNVNSQVLYKFRNQPSYGTWDGFEDQAGLVLGGCATGQYNDRFVDVAEADITLPVVAFGSCTADPYVPDEAVTLALGEAIDFETSIAIESFGGTDGSIVDGVLNVVKNQDAADWAGNVIARGGYIFPLTATDTLVTADVYSTVPATIRMKLELEADTSQSAEVDSTVAHTGSGWETLTFNFAGTNAIDANFDTLVLFPNYGVAGAGNTYQYDNVTFVGGTDTSDPTDLDGDGDGVLNDADAFPNDPAESVDTDSDGIGNNADTDDDGDGVADNLDGDPLDPSVGALPQQLITVDGNPSAILGQSVSIGISYDVSDNDSTLTGLGLGIHYDSSVLTFAEFATVLATDNISSDGPFNDDKDLDNDASTDKYVTAAWASLFGSWPGELPASLLTINFNTAEDIDVDTSTIGFSSVSNTSGYAFAPTSYDMSILSGSWDFDRDGTADALTDGLMLLRYTFGLRGASLTDSAISSNSTLSPSEVEANVAASTESFADIDGNANVDALTDGLMLLRYLFGLRGDSLIDAAVANGASRSMAADIEAYIISLMP